MKLRYIYFFPLLIILVLFMLYTSRNHMILYEKIKNNNNITTSEKNDVYRHGQLHLFFGILLILWSVNIFMNYYKGKPSVFYLTK